MFESKSGVLFVGGLGFFLFAFVSNALVPIFMYQELPEQKLDELVNANLMYQFEDLERRWPEPFRGLWRTDGGKLCPGPGAGAGDLHRRRLLALP